MSEAKRKLTLAEKVFAIANRCAVIEKKGVEECGRVVDEQLPSEHPNSCHIHHKKTRGKLGSDNYDNLIALCKSCHKRKHAGRDVRWSSNGG